MICEELKKAPGNLTLLHSPWGPFLKIWMDSYLCEQLEFLEPNTQHCLLVCQRTVGLYGELLGVRYVWSSD